MARGELPTAKIRCGKCSAAFRVRLKKGRVPSKPIPCPKCSSPIHIRERDVERPDGVDQREMAAKELREGGVAAALRQTIVNSASRVEKSASKILSGITGAGVVKKKRDRSKSGDSSSMIGGAGVHIRAGGGSSRPDRVDARSASTDVPDGSQPIGRLADTSEYPSPPPDAASAADATSPTDPDLPRSAAASIEEPPAPDVKEPGAPAPTDEPSPGPPALPKLPTPGGETKPPRPDAGNDEEGTSEAAPPATEPATAEPDEKRELDTPDDRPIPSTAKSPVPDEFEPPPASQTNESFVNLDQMPFLDGETDETSGEFLSPDDFDAVEDDFRPMTFGRALIVWATLIGLVAGIVAVVAWLITAL